MSYEKALELATNKLNWQVKNKYRDSFNDEDINYYASQLYKLQSTFNGGDSKCVGLKDIS